MIRLFQVALVPLLLLVLNDIVNASSSKPIQTKGRSRRLEKGAKKNGLGELAPTPPDKFSILNLEKEDRMGKENNRNKQKNKEKDRDKQKKNLEEGPAYWNSDDNAENRANKNKNNQKDKARKEDINAVAKEGVEAKQKNNKDDASEEGLYTDYATSYDGGSGYGMWDSPDDASSSPTEDEVSPGDDRTEDLDDSTADTEEEIVTDTFRVREDTPSVTRVAGTQYSLRYEFSSFHQPSVHNFETVEYISVNYLNDYMKLVYGDALQDFTTVVKGMRFGVGFPMIDFHSEGFFVTSESTPNVAELDERIEAAFSDLNLDVYKARLKEVDQSSPFYETNGVTFERESFVGENGNSGRVSGPAIFGASLSGALLALGGALLIRKRGGHKNHQLGKFIDASNGDLTVAGETYAGSTLGVDTYSGDMPDRYYCSQSDPQTATNIQTPFSTMQYSPSNYSEHDLEQQYKSRVTEIKHTPSMMSSIRFNVPSTDPLAYDVDVKKPWAQDVARAQSSPYLGSGLQSHSTRQMGDPFINDSGPLIHHDDLVGQPLGQITERSFEDSELEYDEINLSSGPSR